MLDTSPGLQPLREAVVVQAGAAHQHFGPLLLQGTHAFGDLGLAACHQLDARVHEQQRRGHVVGLGKCVERHLHEAASQLGVAVAHAVPAHEHRIAAACAGSARGGGTSPCGAAATARRRPPRQEQPRRNPKRPQAFRQPTRRRNPRPHPRPHRSQNPARAPRTTRAIRPRSRPPTPQARSCPPAARGSSRPSRCPPARPGRGSRRRSPSSP